MREENRQEKVNQGAAMAALFIFRGSEPCGGAWKLVERYSSGNCGSQFVEIEWRQRRMKMRLLGRVAGLTALLTLCGRAAGAQEPPAAKASEPAAQDASRDGAPVVVTLKS